MAKAFLITFSQTVRVIVDGDEPNDSDIESAFIKAHEAMTINGVNDCLDEVKEDTECPYGTFEFDSK